MRSSELAKMAGVSVRTLRHYHAIGILPEPSRHENGYRDYGPAALLRVLRIRQLSSLGFSLEQIGPMLDDLDAGHDSADAAGMRNNTDALLADLDAELAKRIEALEAQRTDIARLRGTDLSPDMPARAAGALEAIDAVAAAIPNRGLLEMMLTGNNRLAMGIAAHLYSDAELAEVERVFRAILDRNLVPEYLRVSELLEMMPSDAGADERERAAQASAAFLDALLDCFSTENWLHPDVAYDSMLESIAKAGSNAAQRDVSERIYRLLVERLEQREAAAQA